MSQFTRPFVCNLLCNRTHRMVHSFAAAERFREFTERLFFLYQTLPYFCIVSCFLCNEIDLLLFDNLAYTFLKLVSYWPQVRVRILPPLNVMVSADNQHLNLFFDCLGHFNLTPP